jgi:hypothetical protein
MRTTPPGVLMVHAVMDGPITEGSVVEFLLYDPWKDARSDIQAEYDIGALGEVESTDGPFWNPPRWMVSYKEKISVKHGDRIQAKEEKGNQVALAIQQTGW